MSANRFIPADPSLFFSKNDSEDVRWGEKSQRLFFASEADFKSRLQSAEPGWVLAGYPDDEGIKLNGGRVGAAQGPDSIRRYFYRTTLSGPSHPLYDLGNVSVEIPLAERHEAGREAAAQSLNSGHRWLGLGGGHDYGYADGAGFLDVYQNQDPVVINFDAHLDVRPYEKGLSSGTPFRRLIENYPGTKLWEVGLLKVCNSPEHTSWATQRGCQVHFWEDLFEAQTQPKELFKTLRPLAPAFVSIDIDVIENSSAPGCSQSWPVAMDLSWLIKALAHLRQTLDIRAVGIYETSPPLDVDHRTSKLAAQLVHSFVRL